MLLLAVLQCCCCYAGAAALQLLLPCRCCHASSAVLVLSRSIKEFLDNAYKACEALPSLLSLLTLECLLMHGTT